MAAGDVAVAAKVAADFSADAGFSNQSEENCYYADKSGMIFKKAASKAGATYNRYYAPALGDNGSSTTGVLGLSVVPAGAFDRLQKFYADAKSHPPEWQNLYPKLDDKAQKFYDTMMKTYKEKQRKS